MKLINQFAEFLAQEPGLSGIYKHIEFAGRTSYLSWDKMTDDSAKKFVDMLIRSKHTSVLEHGTVYLYDTYDVSAIGSWRKSLGEKYSKNPYSKVTTDENMDIQGIYVTTNLRVLQENGWMDDSKYLCEPTEHHEKRYSVKVITDIGTTREMNRQRGFSITEQSTRYCNFSKDKFGKDITFIKPYWYDQFDEGVDDTGHRKDGTSDMYTTRDFEDYLNSVDHNYMTAIIAGMKPQQARFLLPLGTKTEAVYTAFASDWRHFFDIRLFGKTGESHPDMIVLANLIKHEFEKAGVWEGIMKYPSKYD